MKLRTDVKPIEFSKVIELVEQEYGVSIQEVFPIIEEKPLGSASIAQVHPVVLKNGNRAVVKVQRPGIKEVMAQDIALMRKAAKILDLIEVTGDVIDFKQVIEEMWYVSQQEMDFLLEAYNCKELTQLNSGIAYVTFPKIEDNLTTSRVLVMEYIEGVQIDQIEQLEQLGYDLNEIGTKLAENYIKQVLDDGFFHADPHPGNIWIRNGKIVWLDLGMVGKLNEQDKALFENALIAIVNRDANELKDVILQLGTLKGKVNHANLYEDVEQLLNKYGDMNFGALNLGEMVQEIIDVCNRNGISTPSRITMLARGVMTIEGVLSFCCPDVNFIQIAASHITSKLFQKKDLKKEMQQSARTMYMMAKKSMDIPSQISDLLKMLIKGQSKVNLDVTGAEEPIKQIDHMVDKVIICIISASLLIGSSLISTTNMKPQILDIPLFGILGFFASTGLGIWLLYGILKRWRKNK